MLLNDLDSQRLEPSWRDQECAGETVQRMAVPCQPLSLISCTAPSVSRDHSSVLPLGRHIPPDISPWRSNRSPLFRMSHERPTNDRYMQLKCWVDRHYKLFAPHYVKTVLRSRACSWAFFLYKVCSWHCQVGIFLGSKMFLATWGKFCTGPSPKVNCLQSLNSGVALPFRLGPCLSQGALLVNAGCPGPLFSSHLYAGQTSCPLCTYFYKAATPFSIARPAVWNGLPVHLSLLQRVPSDTFSINLKTLLFRPGWVRSASES